MKLDKNDLSTLEHLLKKLIEPANSCGISNDALPKEFKSKFKSQALLETEFRRFANIFSELHVGEYFDNNSGWVTIRPNSNSYGFSFAQYFTEQERMEQKENFELEKSKVDFKLAKETLKNLPKTRKMAKWAIIISVVAIFLQLLQWIIALLSI